MVQRSAFQPNFQKKASKQKVNKPNLRPFRSKQKVNKWKFYWYNYMISCKNTN